MLEKCNGITALYMLFRPYAARPWRNLKYKAWLRKASGLYFYIGVFPAVPTHARV